MTRIKSEKIDGLIPETVSQEVQRGQDYLQKVEGIRNAHQAKGSRSPWIFGTANPTALDTSIAVFLVRMMDVKRHNLLPQGMREMAELVSHFDEFKKTYAAL